MKLFNFSKQEDRELVAKIRAATQLRLDDGARERMRAQLSEYVQMRPIRAQAPAPLYYETGIVGFFVRHSMPAFAMTLVLVVGGGTAAAAEGALPGDILYPVKVHVNEEMRATLTISPRAKADWQVARAERRLEEAATLALSGKLDDATRAGLDTNLAAHVKVASENKRQLENADDTSDAAEVATNIGAVLVARENILDGKRAAKAAAAPRPEAAATLMMSTAAVAEAPRDAARKGKESGDEKNEAERKGSRTAAKARIEAAKKFLDRADVALSADARIQVETKLKEAAEALSSGDTDVSEGNGPGASSHFDLALDSATKIEAIVSVSKEDKGATDELEQGDDEVGESGTSATSTEGDRPLGL